MFRMSLLLSAVVASCFAQGNLAEAGHRHYLQPVPIAIHQPVYAAPVFVPQPVVTYYQPAYVVHQPVVAPYYYPVSAYYAPAPVYAYPAYIPAHREVEVKYKWRHGRLKVEYDFDD